MRQLAFGFLMAAALLCGETKIPAGAVKVEPYTYRYIDAQGKKWIYRETPFGVVKKEDAETPPIKDNAVPVKVTEEADRVRFERRTPFGLQTWTKKKSDLTEDEKTMMEHARTPEKQ